MGCDVHCVVETKRYDQWWSNMVEPWTPRFYPLFGAMADGVRGWSGLSQKGLPEDVSFDVFMLNNLRIAEGPDEEREITPEEAQRWSDKIFERGSFNWVPDPDNHSHSWLSTAEFEYVLNGVRKKYDNLMPEYYAILAYMNTLESANMPCRLVIWFDN